MSEPFWKTKSLAAMDREEWESLCDGCGRCCVHKFSDAQMGNVYYTDIACRLLDLEQCRCKSYPNRMRLVPNCAILDAENIKQFEWMPATCAYRLLATGRELKWWHPLVSGTPDTVHKAGISVRGKVVSEQDLDAQDWQEHVIFDTDKQ